MNTLTLASIYESQGHKMDALDIYWKILEEDPENEAAKKAIDRLGRVRKVFKNENEKMSKMFVDMSSESEFLAFADWLVS
jgi:hypothetical protein